VRQRRARLRDEVVTLAHGSGGKATRVLVEALFLEELGNPYLDALGDAALLELDHGRLAFTTDSYVVKPIFFPGGSIGELAVTEPSTTSRSPGPGLLSTSRPASSSRRGSRSPTCGGSRRRWRLPRWRPA